MARHGRELPDRMPILSEVHLRTVLIEYQVPYHTPGRIRAADSRGEEGTR